MVRLIDAFYQSGGTDGPADLPTVTLKFFPKLLIVTVRSSIQKASPDACAPRHHKEYLVHFVGDCDHVMFQAQIGNHS